MKKWLVIMFAALLFAVVGVSAQSDEATATPNPSSSPTRIPLTATPVIVEPLMGLSIEPPMEMSIPDDWERVLLDTYIYYDIMTDSDGQLETVPIAVYKGPVTGGEGWIVVLWGFDSIVTIDTTVEQYADRAAWLDGLRMLQFVVFDVRCNIGTAPLGEYVVGEYSALGTTFTAADCPFGIPDTRGWFVSLDVQGLSFAFYVYMDPILSANSQAEADLQSILDTVEFNVEDILVSREEFEATRAALLIPQAEMTAEATAESTEAAGE
jgi:hypothetical protein